MSLTVLLVGLYAFAQKPADIPLQIDKANKAVRQLNGPSSCDNCEFNVGEEEEVPPWRQCLQIVCGHKLNADNRMMSRILATPFYKSDAYKEFNPLVERAFRSQVEAELAAARTAEKYLNENIEDKEADRFAKILSTLDFTDQMEYNSAGELDESKTYDKLMASRSSAEAQLVVEVGKKIAEIQKNKDPLFADDFEYVRQEMSDKDIRQSLEKAGTELISLQKDMESLTGLPEDILGSPTARLRREQRFKDGTFNARDVEDLKREVTIDRFLKTLLTDQKLKAQADQIPGTYNEKFNRAKLRENIKTMEDFLNPRLPKKGSPLDLQPLTHHFNCYTALTLADHSAPSPATIRKYTQFDEPSLRAKYMEKLSPYLSPSSGQRLNQKVKKWKLKTPESAVAFKARLKDSLETLAADNANVGKALDQPREAPWRARFASIYSALRATGPLTETLATDIDDICVKNIPDRFADQASFFEGKFELSGRAMEEGRSSDSTVMHEYSHLVSGFMQKDPSISAHTKKWFNDTMSCLAQGHSDSGEKQVEEDFADMLAGSFAGGGKFYCEVIPEGAEYFTLKNWNSSDATHSGHLYRVLHYRVLTGEGIPPICKTALAEKGESPFERNCLKETPEGSSKATR